MRPILAWSVHLLTASGALVAVLALEAIARADARAVFVWMAVAMAVDSFDGMLARAVDVRTMLPGFDGALLDNVVDYLNYAVVPAWAIWRLAIVPEAAGLPVAAAILLAAAYQFCRRDAKTADHCFRGFPSFWNVAAFYLYFLDIAPSWKVAVLVLLCAASFAPMKWAYPSRMRRHRALTLTLTLLWGVSVAGILAQYPRPAPWLLALSLTYVGFYGALSLWLTVPSAGAAGSAAR